MAAFSYYMNYTERKELYRSLDIEAVLSDLEEQSLLCDTDGEDFQFIRSNDRWTVRASDGRRDEKSIIINIHGYNGNLNKFYIRYSRTKEDGYHEGGDLIQFLTRYHREFRFMSQKQAEKAAENLLLKYAYDLDLTNIEERSETTSRYRRKKLVREDNMDIDLMLKAIRTQSFEDAAVTFQNTFQKKLTEKLEIIQAYKAFIDDDRQRTEKWAADGRNPKNCPSEFKDHDKADQYVMGLLEKISQLLEAISEERLNKVNDMEELNDSYFANVIQDLCLTTLPLERDLRYKMSMPRRFTFSKRFGPDAAAYLRDKRGIERDLITELYTDGILRMGPPIWQNEATNAYIKGQTRRQYGNYVSFFNLDDNGMVTDAFMRAIADTGNDRYSRMEGELNGHQGWLLERTPDGHYTRPTPESADKTLYVFEAYIDMISYMSIQAKDHGMDKLNENAYLALGGVTKEEILESALDEGRYKNIVLAYDNDEAGLNAARKQVTELNKRGQVASMILPFSKDWNEEIVSLRRMESLENKTLSYEDFCRDIGAETVDIYIPADKLIKDRPAKDPTQWRESLDRRFEGRNMLVVGETDASRYLIDLNDVHLSPNEIDGGYTTLHLNSGYSQAGAQLERIGIYSENFGRFEYNAIGNYCVQIYPDLMAQIKNKIANPQQDTIKNIDKNSNLDQPSIG